MSNQPNGASSEELPKEKSKKDWAKYFVRQFSAARKKTRKYHKDGNIIVDRFLGRTYLADDSGLCESQLNLFNSNITTLQSMLYGNLPKVEVDRTFADANDDVARVAGEIATRMLNQDIQDAGEDYGTMLRSALQDRLLPGMGTARVVYDFIEETVEHPPVMDESGMFELAPAYSEMKITEEWVDEIYVNWMDILWSPCRTYSELRWKAFRSYMTKPELEKRFGKELAEKIPLSSHGAINQREDRKDEQVDLEPQAQVWEIWYKPDMKVIWFVEGMDEVLEVKNDYLELDEFWPDPPPMIANPTTREFIPRADYTIAQDIYKEIDELETRITLLTRACKAVGVYDKESKEVGRMLTEGVENQLIPANNWAMFAEKGGLKGAVDWLPLEHIAQTIEILTAKQLQKIQQLYEVTGLSDIMRGAAQKYEAATTSKVKAQFASTRVQALQEELARFASDLQRKKFQIIQKHFSEECIKYQSNIELSMDGSADPEVIPQAIALLKDPKKARWRITIRPETLAMIDYQRLKEERTEYINALAVFLQSSAPLAQLDKKAVPVLLQLLQWGLAGFKGSNQVEGVLDRAILMYQQQAEQPEQEKPDPEMIKAQMKMQEIQAKMAADQQKHQAELQQDREKHQQEMQQKQMEFQMQMKQMQEEFQIRIAEMVTSLQVKEREQQTQFTYNTAEREHQLNVQKQQAKLKPANGAKNA